MKKILLSLFVTVSFLAVSAQTDSLQQYTGKFKFPDGSPVTILTSKQTSALKLPPVNLINCLVCRIRILEVQHGAASLLKVLSGVAVGPRERVVLMEVNDTWLIVGVAPGQVRTLHTMPKGTLPSGMNNPAAAPDGKFQMWLKQMVEKRNEGK